MKMSNKTYSKLTVEEIIVAELDSIRDVEAYRYLSDDERKQWRILIVRTLLSVRRAASWVMVMMDLLMYTVIGSALFRAFIVKKNTAQFCAMAFTAAIIDVIFKRIVDYVEAVYIQKTLQKKENAVLEYFSAK